MKNFGENRSEFANMPKDVKMEQYPKNPSYLQSQIVDDSMMKVDKANSQTKSRLSSHKPKSMY